MTRIAYDDVYAELLRITLKYGFEQADAELCARLFAETSLDGVYSHGVNKFPYFIKHIQKGAINPRAVPEKVASLGDALERWDGRQGPGNLNAYRCMNRAIELAKAHGMGAVALRNTNHWMRAGTYGWQAADAGCLGVCFTNTIGNMPPWGGAECRIGNNPLVIAVPREDGHLVLDMAVSLFSYGKMAIARNQGQLLPFEGGYDQEGRLTRDAGQILQTKRPLPIGYWKGSGLAMMLDLLAAILADGRATADIGMITEPDWTESGVSQMFVCFDLSSAATAGAAERIADQVVAWVQGTPPADPGQPVRYPGERTLQTRQANQQRGIPIDERVWAKVTAL